jgi:hypothetical protein
MISKFFSRIINEYKQSSINSLFESLKYEETIKCKNILALYLDGGGNINIRNIEGIPLINYIIYSHIGNVSPLVQLLINRGADINIKSDDRLTPLMIAADQDDFSSVKLLIEAGADLNIKDKFNFTALAYAIGNLNYEIIELLLINKANINIELKDCRYNYIDIYDDTTLKEFADIVYNNIPEKSDKRADFINDKYEKMHKSYLSITKLLENY